MLRRTVILLAVATASPVSAVPPAPLAPGVVERDTAIITVPPPGDVDEYIKHFANDVKIYENEKSIGTGVSAWKFYLDSHRNVSHQVKLVSHGNPIIVAESTYFQYNECCLSARIVTYHLREDGQVDEVRITSNGVYWGQL